MSDPTAQKPSRFSEGFGQDRLDRRHLFASSRPKYAMQCLRLTISAAVVLSALGIGLVGCSSMKTDGPPPCDPGNRQAHGMASMGASPNTCTSLIHPTTDIDH